MDADTIVSRRSLLQSTGAVTAGLGLAGSVLAGSGPATSAGKPFRGLFPIAQTPFTSDDKLDHDCLAAEVKFCNRGGVPGFVWPQIASGWSTMTETERLAGAETILAAGKGARTSLVIGVQAVGGDVDTSIRYARHAASHGADAIVSLPPERGDDQARLDYYKRIAAATDLPLVVQTIGDMSVDLVVEMFKQIPTMKCVKDEAGEPLARIGQIRARTNDRLPVFAGNGVRTMLDELRLGFAGFCPTTALADLYQITSDLWLAGKRREAFDMFGRIQAIQTIPGAAQYLLVARGVFKETTTSRRVPGSGGGRNDAPPDDAQKGFIRQSVNEFLRPYLRA